MLKYLLAASVLALGVQTASAAPTNFVEGVSNLPATHWMSGRDVLDVPYPARWQVWFDDFTKYTAGDWVITTTEAGSGDATEALADTAFGALVITNDTADDDRDFLQSVGEVFDIVAGKAVYFEARFKINEVIQSDFIMGLQVRDTTPLAVTDGVYFQKDDGDVLLDMNSLSNSVASSTTGLYSLVADTYYTVAFYYDGATNITAAVDNVIVGQLASVTPSGTEMTISFGIQQGEVTNLKVLTVDYILVAFER